VHDQKAISLATCYLALLSLAYRYLGQEFALARRWLVPNLRSSVGPG